MRRRALSTALAVLSFFGLLGLIGWLAAQGIVRPQMAMLMGIGALGLYIGFGILIAIHRLISKLD